MTRLPRRGVQAPLPRTGVSGVGVMILLGLLWVTRIISAATPTTALWGVHLLGHVPLAWAVGLTLLVGSSVWVMRIPSRLDTRRADDPKGRERSPLESGGLGWAWHATSVVALAVFVWLLPDQLLHVGDAMLRQNALHAPSQFMSLNPQALPLDDWIHDRATRWLMRVLETDGMTVSRMLGALEAGLMATLAVGVASALGATAGIAAAVVALVSCSGALGLFGGYSKALSELSLVTAAVGALGIGYLRTGRGWFRLCLAISIGLASHRLALGLLPAWGVAGWLRHRAAVSPARRWTWGERLATLLPLITLVVLSPQLWRVLTTFDSRQFLLPWGAVSASGDAGGEWPGRWIDIPNMILFVCPLAPLALLAPRVARGGENRLILGFLAALVIPMTVVLIQFRSPMGLIRNWDVFAPVGVAWSIAVAWVVVHVRGSAHETALRAIAVGLQAVACGVLLLVHQNSTEHGLSRLRMLLSANPPLGDVERASTFDFMGQRLVEWGRLDEAAEALENSAQLTPTPRILRQWATVEAMRGRLDRAVGIYRTLLERKPTDAVAWLEYARLSHSIGDRQEAHRAAREAHRLAPEAEAPRKVLDWMESQSPAVE